MVSIPKPKGNKMTIEWAKPKRNGGTHCSDKSGVYFSASSAGEGREPQMTIGIQADTMKTLLWVIGDRVLVGRDTETGEFVIARNPNGHKLTARSTRKRSEATGQSIAASVKLVLPSFVDAAKLPASCDLAQCKIDGLEIRFTLY
jgi:hypothetical protein